MIVNLSEKIDSGALKSFIKKTNVNNYNAWPNTNSDNRRNLLVRQISSYKNQKFFYAENKNQIVALLIFSDLAWDSTFFNKKIGRIDLLLCDKSAKQDEIQHALQLLCAKFKEFLSLSEYDHVSISIDSWDNVLAEAVQDIGFKYILTWINGFVTSQAASQLNIDDKLNVRPIEENEIPYFVDIASTQYFPGGRFYFDHNFNKNDVHNMYSELIKSSYKGKDELLVLEWEKQPLGLMISKKLEVFPEFSKLRVYPLRFLLLDSHYRSRGLGEELFKGTLKYLHHTSDIITTGLEVHNYASLNLHKKLDFRFNYTHNVFHFWK